MEPEGGADDVEVKRNTLLELVDAVDSAPRLYFADMRVLEDAFTMVRVHTGVGAWVCVRAPPHAPAHAAARRSA